MQTTLYSAVGGRATENLGEYDTPQDAVRETLEHLWEDDGLPEFVVVQGGRVAATVRATERRGNAGLAQVAYAGLPTLTFAVRYTDRATEVLAA